MTTTLIRSATVLTLDGERNIYAPGAVVVSGREVADIGPSDAVESRTTRPDKVIEGQGRVVLPGFVSAHNHLGYAVFRGRAEDIGHAPAQRLYMPMATVISREERRDVGNLAAAEMLAGGTTTVLQMEEDADVHAPFIEQIGLRAAMGIMVDDVDVDKLVAGETVFSDAKREQQLGQAIEFAEAWHGKANGRISAMMTANGLASSSPKQLRGLRDAADRLGLRLSVHMGTGEGRTLRRLYDAGSVEFAREHGFLAPDVVAVHGYRLNPDELPGFAESGAHLAHCPQMNAFRGEIAPVGDLRARGVNVGLGVDNYFSDSFEVMRACIAVARIREEDSHIVPAAEVLELATLAGARAMGLEKLIGSLEVGKRADIQIVDMRRYGLTPINDPVRTLVYHGHAKDVETVMVDGEVVVENGAVRGVDDDALLEAAARAAEAAWSRFAERYGGYVAAP